MTRYEGFRRTERLSEMATMIYRYSLTPQSGLITETPMEISQLTSLRNAGLLMDESGKEGGQGLFSRIKNTDGKLAIKIFDPELTEPSERIKRAASVKSALKILNSLNIESTEAFLLFNLLNIPKQYIVDSSGGLMGLLVPAAPSSCYIDTEFLGKTCREEVRIGDIIPAERHLIPRRKNSSDDDPLPLQAKWSFLDSLCQAVSSLHVLGLIHADLSSNNVFVRWCESSDPKAYVIDAFNGYSAKGTNKTLGRMRSDVFCPRSFQLREYTPATDVYCLAWWIVHIAIAASPIGATLPLPNLHDADENGENLYRRHRYVTEALELKRRTIPSWLSSILQESLQPTPACRPSSRELTYAIHDHWLNYGDSR